MWKNDPARAVVDIITGTWQTQALYVAVALRLPDHVSAGHITSSDLAVAADADPDGIIRLMRLLTAIGVFGGDDHSGYAMTDISRLLRTDAPGSMRDMCLMYGEEFHRAWGEALAAVRVGQAGFEAAFGRTLHEYLAQESGSGPRFLRAMNAGSPFFSDVPDVYGFEGVKTITDVAGGSGKLLATILQVRPATTGVLFDREHMLPMAKEHLSSTLDPDRFTLVAGDFFESVPPGSDVYLLSRILQDWDDSSCITLLTNVRRAMRRHSDRLLIVERVINETGTRVLPVLFDLHLLMMAGGRERTLAGYKSLLEGAGMRLEAIHDLALETTLLVARPA